MGFADYLSRHPISQPTGENLDNNHVINTIEAIHYTLQTMQRKLTNRIARKQNELNGVTNHSNPSKHKENASCHLHAIEQLPPNTLNNSNNTILSKNHTNSNLFIRNHLYKSSITPSTNPLVKSLSSRSYNSINPLFSTKIHVTTRSNLQVETFQVPIKKRHRAPNKKKTQTMATPQETNTIATQTEETSNLGKGHQPLEDREHFNPISELDYENTPDYLKQLHRVFGENFIAEATRNDPQSRNLLQIIEDKNWESLRHFSRYWHSLNRDLSTTPAGCILYDGKTYIPTQFRKLIMNSIHRNHPGHTGMMHLANIIWFPRNHREILTLTQNCQPCIEIGKNLKPVIPKS